MKENVVNKTKISLILNYIIFIMVVFATIIMFIGIKISFVKEPVLETSGLSVLKFFTVDSNILVGISAILLAYKERKLLTGKIKDIPVGYYVMKFIGTVSVSLTFIVVFLYLGRIATGGLISLLQNSNLFFHLIVPVLSILSFVLFEKTNKIKFGYVMFCLIPVLLYGIYYIVNILIHLENNQVLPKYDWYFFVQKGINNAYIIAPIIFVLTFIIGSILWILNKKEK